MRWEHDDLMTVAEVAARLKLNQQTIRNWMDAGTLPYIRLGERRVRVWRADLQALLDGGSTVKPAPAPAALTIWDGVVGDPIIPGGRQGG